MNQMNVAGMNPGQGGPGGGVPMINNGSAALRTDGGAINTEQMVTNLNTYIYDYFLKRGYHDSARALMRDAPDKLNIDETKASPSHRRDGDLNGVDTDGMMADSKDGDKLKIPDDLPPPLLQSEAPQSSFLLEWFSLFWEMFWTTRKKGQSPDARSYIQYAQGMLRLREHSQNQILRQQPMVQSQLTMPMRRNGMAPNLQKAVLQNNANLSPQQLSNLSKIQQMQLMQHHMQREHSDMDINGHRPQSPSSTENAPSPSKRPRLEGTHINGQQMAPGTRAQGQLPGQPASQAFLMQNGINPRAMNPAQLQAAFQQSNPSAQQKLQVYAQHPAFHRSRSALNNQGMPNGLMNPGVMPNQNDLMPPIPDGQGLLPIGGEYYGANGQIQVRPGMQTPANTNGTHALQDYQMQLMLLEQQNKRRLMMARQEQDNMVRDGQPGPALPPGTSPQGSRTGASPNPSEQMKRGTPKLPQSGLPGSPSAGENIAQGRGSPAPLNFNGSQMAPEMGFFIKQDGLVAPNMRPPSSNPAGFNGPQMGQPMDAIGRQQPAGAAARMSAGSWPPQQPQQPPQSQPQSHQHQQQQQQQQQAPQQPQQQQQPTQQQQAQQQAAQSQPMIPQPSQANQHQASGTPQERNAMPPPQAPTAGGANTGRTQPLSPQPGAAPPTPQQSNKPAPKPKKEAKDNRKRPSKKASTAPNAANAAATPSSEAEPPPTPAPSAPITPQHPNSFNKTGANTATSAPQQPATAAAPQPLVQPTDPNQQSYGELNMTDTPAFNLDFSALENPDILENFDFDTFLNTDADGPGFGFDPNMAYSTDGVETGTGDPL